MVPGMREVLLRLATFVILLTAVMLVSMALFRLVGIEDTRHWQDWWSGAVVGYIILTPWFRNGR